MQTAPADLLVGRLLEGRYRILDRIARGGMSTVYAAVDERLDRLVAVKVMSSTLSSDPKFGDRFAREARAAAKLTHVNAVSVYDQGHDISDGGHHVFLVMELVDGRTLRDLIRERSGRFTPAEAISIMEPVLAALAAAHRAGLVHRDVKPENILLSDAGVVKVADFGLARAIDADAASTRTGLMMGTVAYCAPEQISRGYADARSDVYSAGVVLFELLTGRTPYQGESAMNVAYQHVHSRVPAPSSKVKGVPNEIDELVVAATDSDPGSRPPDGASFLAEIADVRAELGLPVAPVPARPRTPTPTPREARENRARASTDVLDGHPPHDTEIVDRRAGPPRPDGPPPPVVIPPPKQRPVRTAKARRRRRAWIALAIVILVGALSVFGGIAAVRWYQRWNSHVPQLSGRTLTTATQIIEQDHYALGLVTREFSESVPTDSVISSDPGDGARLEQGKPIDLVISLGKDRIDVPSVYKATLGNAESILTARGVTIDTSATQYIYSNTVKQGSVVRIVPAAGTSIKRSDPVQLYVSRGQHLVQVPSISPGTKFDEAKRAINAQHLKVDETMVYDQIYPAGQVVSVGKSGQVLYGSTVPVQVSKGPQYTDMPNIPVGTPFAQARDQLVQLGLHVKRDILLGSGKQNLVVGQSPSPGTQVVIGDTVILQVV